MLWLAAGSAPALDAERLGSLHMQRLDEAAPHFTLSDASGGMLRLADLRGHPLILHFWATWCEPCRAELPALAALVRDRAADGAVLVMVSIDEEADADSIRRYAQSLGVSLDVYLARDGDITDRYWVWGVPVTYLIDRQGLFLARALGPRNWDSPDMRSLIGEFARPTDQARH
jgi:thiol-disulfide isomerase/thioredoxin